jgi:hypothetical protein
MNKLDRQTKQGWLTLPETRFILEQLRNESIQYTINLKKIPKTDFDTEVGFIRGIDHAISIIEELEEK